MTHTPTLGAKISALATTMSPYPPSFDNNGWLYFTSLVSLLSITMFCSFMWGWMIRDLWRDRFIDHPYSLMFLNRFMMAIISGTGFVRIMPEVVYMTCYGEVTGARMGQILSAKRMADTLALPSVVAWMTIFVLIYPHLVLLMKSKEGRAVVIVDPVTVWPRLGRPVLCFITILVIAASMAVAKGAMGHGA